MISRIYEKPEFNIVYFSVSDILTASDKVVHTTNGSNSNVTLPGTTSSGGVDVEFSDFYQ
ncbi:MAG: hypothetical protein ACI4IF_05325 [Acutalibacteraceae bacterium]